MRRLTKFGYKISKSTLKKWKTCTFAREKHPGNTGTWTTFDDIHPNLIVHHDNSVRSRNIKPFSHGYAESTATTTKLNPTK